MGSAEAFRRLLLNPDRRLTACSTRATDARRINPDYQAANLCACFFFFFLEMWRGPENFAPKDFHSFPPRAEELLQRLGTFV